MLFLLGMHALAQPIPHQDLRWRAIHDTVMGGVSSGTVDQTDEGLLFQGFLSLENNGGFTSIRARVDQNLSQNIEGLRIRVVGDGRNYLTTLRTDSNPRVYYRQEFSTIAGEETEIRLPLLEFQPHVYGRFLAQVPPLPLQLSPVQGIGLMLADKNQGPFSLRILSIETYGNLPPSPSLSVEEQTSLLEAIQAGVPLYNQGRSDLCAGTYHQALVNLQNRTSSPWFVPHLAQKASSQDRRAWWYRHMINHLLQTNSS